MRVGFAGTPGFAATALAAIADAGFDVPLALTRPDRAQGRGLHVQPSPVKAEAGARGIPVLQPATLRTPQARAPIVACPLDALVVAAYGLILPPEVLAWPRHGCINIHASLLPRWRGAAPIERAILEGDRETGISLMQMDAGVDTGPVIERIRVPIADDDTGGSLTARLAATGAAAIVAALGRLRDVGTLPALPQPDAGATYAPKLAKAEAAIDWTASASAIARRIRAFAPAPGAASMLGARRIRVRRAEVLASAGPAARPGEVVAAGAAGIVVACGEGALRIAELQPAGGRAMTAAAFVAGRGVAVGDTFAPSR
jgi:methionyl-tRNA formyltransferase